MNVPPLKVRVPAMGMVLWGIDFPGLPFWRERRRLKIQWKNRMRQAEVLETRLTSSFESVEWFSVFLKIRDAFRKFTTNRTLQLVPEDEMAALSILFDPWGMLIEEICMDLEDEFDMGIASGDCATIGDLVQ